MAESRWRRLSREVIARTLAGLPPGADDAAKRRALRAAYPFGVREHHPYKMWCAEVRLVLAAGLTPRRGRHLAEAIRAGRAVVAFRGRVSSLDGERWLHAASSLELLDGYHRLAVQAVEDSAHVALSSLRVRLTAERVQTRGGLPLESLGLGLGLPPELRPGDEGDLERLEGWCVEAWDVVMRYIEAM